MIDHARLRRENEPSLNELLREQAIGNREVKGNTPKCSVDVDLIQRVLKNEEERDVRRDKRCVQRMLNGQRAKRQNLSTTGKNLTPVPAADSITDTFK